MGHPKQHFPFLPGPWIRATHPEYKRSTHHGCRRAVSALALAINWTEVRRVGEVHLPVQSGTELTDYHILSI